MADDRSVESGNHSNPMQKPNRPPSTQEAETIPPASDKAPGLESADGGRPKPTGQSDLETVPPQSRPPQSDTKSPGEPTLTQLSENIEVPGYEILNVLGRGGMGVVYKARHLTLNRVVALKMILAGGHAGAQDVQRFLSEAEAVAAFSHPNIVQVYDFGRHSNLPYMALEFVSGGSLAGKLENQPLAAAEAARLVEQIARGMNAAHQAGIVHRDLKPANVLLTAEGVPKITDFGLAKKIEGGAEITRTGAIMGTPSYMSPEQAGGDGKRVGPAADVYAMGAILYECLTGRPPFQADNPLDIILQVVDREPTSPSLPMIPPTLSAADARFKLSRFSQLPASQ